jgi:simple sugar transport system ATP-binding protein
VHQHFTLVPPLSVLENLSLGRDAGVSGLRQALDRVRADAERLMGRTGLVVRLDDRVENLGVGDRQRVEILKALLREPTVLVLDEPTAVLTPAEVEALFGLLRELAAQGRAVVLVAHKIDEILSVADRVTVLRRGRTVMSSERSAVDAPSLIRAMVGEGASPEAVGAMGELVDDARAGPVGPRRASGPEVARLDGIRARRPSGAVALSDVSLTVRRGEIVGVAGVEGNGQRELALVLSGRVRPDAGAVSLPEGVGFIPQDRTVEGIIPDFDLVENVALALHDDPTVRRGVLLEWASLRRRTETLVSRFDVVTPGVEARAGALSGGNQQRLVVGRELLRARDLLVAENPARGLDVAATAFVHAEIERIASEEDGPGVVLISTDLDEIIALSSRIMVMTGGRLREVPEERRSHEGIGALMLAGESVDA